MATVAECEQAFASLAARLAETDPQTRKRNALNRTLSCSLPDLGVIFGGRLHDGLLTEIRQVQDPGAQIRLRMSSDDLIKVVDGELNMTSAWTAGRVKIEAKVFDLMKLRSIF
jgi:alkyl sulfatase BDS1-like metallo-beta-lactamase superfamily hydrolase